ncbi:Coenzyme F420 hydrogenase/dehydrogenase, beta subunit C-terminal domain [Rhodococcus sp. NPDC077669]|uniref:Coenzyme F420 hydrogenase/dehydrogenase, beta subunit C-terminal domain n=1 Tax=Rhodococcus sp. NPDC077669 TaxID=3155174 RepID=UPI00341CA7BF
MIEEVIDNGNCSGCGFCASLDSSISMQLDREGFLRPFMPEGATASVTTASSADLFSRSCPGLLVSKPQSTSNQYDLPGGLGSALSVWSAEATDDVVRFVGSSGGALSALQMFLLDTHRMAATYGVAADDADPERTVPHSASTSGDVMKSAGSRYAPSSSLVGANLLASDSVVVGKPCEISALRQSNGGGVGTPLRISFFCAGVPSQEATSRLVRSFVDPAVRIDQLRYRGHGWPGKFFVAAADGTEGSMSYSESWGRHLNQTLQWRCKICPDGVGDSADISGADYWDADENGWPILDDRPGRTLLIAKTERGLETVLGAESAGYIRLAKVDLADFASVQRYQVDRRRSVAGRVLGGVVGGATMPKYVGYGMVGKFARNVRQNLRAAVGTFRRVRNST